MAENIPERTDLTIPETKVIVYCTGPGFVSFCILHFVVAGNEPQ
jgi:hypothetical protein